MHGVKNTTNINIYFNNNNSLLRLIDVLQNKVECTLLNTFKCFIYILTTTCGIGSKIIPIWQIVKWMHMLNNLPQGLTARICTQVIFIYR